MVRLGIHTTNLEPYHQVIQSILQWTPHVKVLLIHFKHHVLQKNCICAKLFNAVQNNMHLQLVNFTIILKEDEEYLNLL